MTKKEARIKFLKKFAIVLAIIITVNLVIILIPPIPDAPLIVSVDIVV